MNKFSASSLSFCPRQMVLSFLGVKKTISPFLMKIFEIGNEFDAVFKEEAYEEWDDYYAPKAKIFQVSNGKTKALIRLTPDGIRPNEIVEFKGLSPNNFNTVKTEEDLTGPNATPLFQKYAMQVETYAHFYKKKWIRFRVKNKRNLKQKDIVYKASPARWQVVRLMILKAKEMVDFKRYPTPSCSSREKKTCLFKDSCNAMTADEIDVIKEKDMNKFTRAIMYNIMKSYLETNGSIKRLEEIKNDLSQKMKNEMKKHGKKEFEQNNMMVKYGVRWKQQKDKETIDKLVERGMIPTKDVPEEYLRVDRMEE